MLTRLWRPRGHAAAESAARLALSLVGVREGNPIAEGLVVAGGGTSTRSAWCAYGAAGLLRIAGWGQGFELITQPSGGVVRWWQRLHPHERLAEGAALLPGDLYFRTRAAADVPGVLAGGSALGHMGMVVEPWSGSGKIVTVDCNTNGAGSADGDGIYRREVDPRDARLIGFARVAWRGR